MDADLELQDICTQQLLLLLLSHYLAITTDPHVSIIVFSAINEEYFIC